MKHIITLAILSLIGGFPNYWSATAMEVAALPACPNPDAAHAKHIFLFIGDGMGANQRLLAELTRNGTTPPAVADYRQLLMNSLPVTGLVNTRSANSWITDSAAAGTAMACGQKTANHVIAMDTAGKTAFASLAEFAHAHGMRVGLATSVAIDDATTSAFGAHAANRGEHAKIATEMMASSVEFLAGNSYPDSRSAAMATAAKTGRQIVTASHGMPALKPDGNRVWFTPQNGDDKGARSFAIDQPGDDATPTLAELTSVGIRSLDNENGFLFMVESGRIDWGCHANDPGAFIGDILALDQAVATAIAFYREHPADTLILVTADHETGGLTLGRQETGYTLHPDFLTRQKCSAVKLTGKIRAWRAAGKSADEVRALLKTEWLDWGKSTELERALLAKAYTAGKSSPTTPAKNGELDPLAVACLELAASRAGIAWCSHAHTAAAVPVTAIGSGQNRFTGWQDNTDLFRKLQALITP